MNRSILSLLCTVAAAPLAAQGGPEVRPGQVSTVPVSAPAGAPGPVRYRLEPAAGVRLFSATRGSARSGGAGEVRFPVTLSLAGGRAPGPVHLAAVELRYADGAVRQVSLVGEVPRVRGLTAALDSGAAAVPRGGAGPVGFTVANLGNAPDTVSLRLVAERGWTGAHARMVLAAGERRRGTLRLLASDDVREGDVSGLRLTVEGTGTAVQARGRARAVRDPGPYGALVQVPATVFVGSSADRTPGGDAPLTLAVEGGGFVSPDTRVRFAFRRDGEYGYLPFAFHRAVAAPRLFLGVYRGDLLAEAGDVSVLSTGLTGRSLWGRGASVRAGVGPVKVEAFAAGPRPESGRTGHRAYARAAFPAGAAEWWVAASAQSQGALVVAGEERVRAATVGGSGRSGRHRWSAEAGAMSLDAGRDRRRRGGALEVTYGYAGDGSSLDARVRRVPFSPRWGGSGPSEAALSGSTRRGPWRASAWGSATESSYPGVGDARTRSAGARLGWGRARWLGVGGRVHEYRGLLGPSADLHRRTAFVDAGGVLGPLRLDATAEAGRRERGGDPAPYREVRGSAAVRHGRQSARVGVSFGANEYEREHLSVNAGADLERGPVQLQALAGVGSRAGSWMGASRHGSVTAVVAVGRATDVVAGTEYQGWRDRGPWLASLGVRRRVHVPLPLQRAPVVRGVAFEDRDADGVRDAGEPGVAGVALALGRYRRTVSDSAGRFSFADEGSAERTLTVETSSVPLEMFLSQGAEYRARGMVDVPLARYAGLSVTAYLDADRDGVRDPGEAPAADLVLRLRPAAGTPRGMRTDAAGEARFANALPGEYVLEASTSTVPGARGVSLPLRLRGGEEARRDVAVPVVPREIRMAPPTARVEVLAPFHAYFGVGRADLRTDQRGPLRAWLGEVLTQPGVRLCVAGHADRNGPAGANVRLGLRRAGTVVRELVRGGFPAARIRATTFGEEHPADPRDGLAAWARNRRVEVRAYRGETDPLPSAAGGCGGP